VAIVRCGAIFCRHNDGGFCKAEAINMVDREYYDEAGEPLEDQMVCISFWRRDRIGKD